MNQNLKFVTFTGADNTVDPEDMLNLSKEYHWIEWGILVSKDNFGTHRFPSEKWIDTLLLHNELAGNIMNLSLHVCGRWVRDLLKGSVSITVPTAPFKRIQLNFHAERTDCNVPEFSDALLSLGDHQFIFQIDDADGNKHLESVAALDKNINVAPLYDTSGGRGISPLKWNKPMNYPIQGYAGGLGPGNLEDQLTKILEVSEGKEIWVDMETKLYDSNLQFVLDRCRTCAEIAKKVAHLE